MGGCFSKKEKAEEDPSSSPRARGGRKGHKTASVGSRDPPPTESPQEEKVKEVLSETPKITRQNSNSNKKEKDSDRGNRDATVDRSEVREEFSAASTTLTETTATTITRETAAEDDGDGAGETEMKKMRPAVTRSRSSPSFQKKINRSDFNFKDVQHRPAAAGKREIRGVDVGCRSARSSPSPTTAREKGNAMARNRVSAAAAAAGGGGHNNNNNTTTTNKNSNYYSNYKRSDRGERSGSRSLSPAMKKSAAPAMNQRQCRANTNLLAMASTTTTTATTRAMNINGRLSPQMVPPARELHLEEARRGQDGNNAGSAGGGEDGNALESLENPLVSMECFIFL